MPILTIDARDWFRGISTSDELADGGFSPLSKGINLFAMAGLLLPGPAPLDVGTSSLTTKGVFAWSTHHTNVSPGIGRALGANSSDDGKFFTMDDAGTPTLAASDTSRDYKVNESDMIRYGASNEQFTTSTTDVAKSNFDFSSNDFNWWRTTLGLTTLVSGVPHHFCQYGTILYFSDGRYIHSWDGTTGTYNALDLPVGYVITDIRVYQNLIFIAAAKFDPLGGGESTDCRIFTWDGFSDSFLDELPVQEKIDSLIVFGGTLFVTTASYVAYFTGSTISPLYPLTSNVYKYQFAITKDRLYLLQGADVLCYGNPILSRPKFFSFPLKYTGNLVGITSYRSGKIVYASSTQFGSWSDVNGSNQAGGIFYGNRLPFGAQVRIRAVILEHEALASGSSVTIEYIDDQQVARSVGTLSFAAFGAVTKHRFNTFNKPATLTLQSKLTFGVIPNKGIRRIHIWYEPSELRENK